MRGEVQVKAIVGGRIITVTGPVIDNGVILVDDNGVIREIGKHGEVKIPDDTEVIEAYGKTITPGFIDAHSHLGLIPEGLDWEYSDVNDYYSPITAHLRAIDALDPYDKGFNDAVAGGVTTIYTGPGSANVIGGIGLVMKTYGESLDEMVLNPEAAVKMALGPKRQREVKSKYPYPTSRMGTVALLRQWLLRAREYLNGRTDIDKIDPEDRAILEVLARVLKREMLAKIHLSTSPDEIYAIVRIIKEFNLRATIDHVFGGQLLADMLARENIQVVYGPPMVAKIASFFRYVDDKAPVVMYRSGVNVSIMSDHPVIPEKHLRLLAAVTVKNGLTLNEALDLITINPARQLGLEDKLGSIEPGKDADLVIASDHPVKPTSTIEMVLVKGRVAYNIK